MDGAVAAQGISLGYLDPNWVARGTGDFNGDGSIDILWRNSTGAMAIWFMNGTTFVSSAAAPTVSDPAWKVAGVGDLNNDGRADIIWRHDTGNVTSWLMNGATFIGGGPALPPVADLNWQPVGTGDFNGDGQTDLLWFYKPGQQAHVWLSQGASPGVRRRSPRLILLSPEAVEYVEALMRTCRVIPPWARTAAATPNMVSGASSLRRAPART